MKKCFAVQSSPTKTDIALLLLRLFVGYAFIIHGWGKIQNPMGWMPPDAPIPGFLQLLPQFPNLAGASP